MRFLRRIAVIVPCLLFLLFELGCGDQYRPIANPIVSPGGQPQNAHYAFVLSYNPIGFGSDTKIDVSGDTNLQVLSMGYGSVAEAFQATVQGAVFVANRDGDFISEYSLIGTVAVINVALYPGSRPVALASTSSTSTASTPGRCRKTTGSWSRRDSSGTAPWPPSTASRRSASPGLTASSCACRARRCCPPRG